MSKVGKILRLLFARICPQKSVNATLGTKTAKGCTRCTALCCLFVLAEAGMPLSGQMLTIKLYYSLLKHSLRHLHKSRNIRTLNVVDIAIILGTILHAGCVDRLHDIVELAIYLGS